MIFQKIKGQIDYLKSDQVKNAVREECIGKNQIVVETIEKHVSRLLLVHKFILKNFCHAENSVIHRKVIQELPPNIALSESEVLKIIDTINEDRNGNDKVISLPRHDSRKKKII